jgi:acyl transferase domain-containing protein/acyl carrier protein
MTILEAYDDGVEPIAIVGISGRFPGAKNIDQFWQNLRDGVESISFFSDDEVLASGVAPDLLAKPNYIKAFGFLPDVELFDAAFFGFHAREAETMDPQHRIFLECAWEAIESAGYNPETYEGQIGVFSGASLNSYWLKNLALNQELPNLVSDFQILLGNDKDFVPTRVSYKLNLKGPSINVSTACSTSLVAVQMACQSLLNYQSDMALAGGIAIRIPQKIGYLYQEGMILSPDGHCRAFDARSQGTVGGSGVGIVVLKRLSDAIADGDFIYALIRGAAINNDGALKVGYTAPSVEGQAAVISEAQAIAGIDPQTISYIEAHGTGTELGDPIEIAALTTAFRASTDQKGFCAIGSLKTNVGHLDTAAGVAGLIKTALALQHKQIPPSLHFESPNPKIDFASSPFYVNTTIQDWQRYDATPRRAGVSSFGIGGTNAHVVLEEAPELEPSSASRHYQLLLLSAKTPTALDAASSNLVKYLQQQPHLNLADVAHTLQVGRQQFMHRRMLVCQNVEEAISYLDTQDPQRVFSQSRESVNQPVVFMFSGQGSQYVGMAQDLYEQEPNFCKHLDRCCQILRSPLGFDLREILYPVADQRESATQKLQQTAITQPALFAIEYSLAQLWISWGISPKAMIGHSIGEYVAACLAGVFSLEDALGLVTVRGRLMQELPAGSMLAVPLAEEEIKPLLNQDLSIAAINGQSLCVVSGLTNAVELLEQQLAGQGLECRRLHTSHAFHSIMMEPMLAAFRSQIQKFHLHPPKIAYISNVSGNWITAAEATDPNYWVKHIRQPVRFYDGLKHLLQDSQQVLLEVGAGRTLSTLARRHPHKTNEQVILTSLRHPQDQWQDLQPDLKFLLTTLGQLWLAGVPIDWAAFYEHERRYRLTLPTYPFERQRYWIEPTKTETKLIPQASLDNLDKKKDIADWFYRPCWKQSIPPRLDQEILSSQSCWLVFIDTCGIGSQLVERLQQHNQDVVVVHLGDEFSQLSDRTFTLNPAKAEEYNQLLNQLVLQQKKPTKIIHLWSITSPQQGKLDLERVNLAEERGLYSLMFLAQALEKQNFHNLLQITVFSNHMQNITSEDLLCPEKASLLGAIKVIPLEYPHISCRSIDILVPHHGSKSKEKLIEHLLAELTNTPDQIVVAYRGFQRWVQTYEPIRLEQPLPNSLPIKEDGVYLITGGLGAIGLTLAEYFAKNTKTKLILTRRSYFPPQSEWNQWLNNHEAQNQISLKILQLQAIQDLGTEILIANVDVADLEQMQKVISQAEQQFGRIDGGIHCAGVADYDGRISRRSPEMLASILSAKVKGTLILDRLFQDRELDFLVLFSSLGSVLYQLKIDQIGYSAACEFMDAFAHYRTYQEGKPTIAINWTDWLEVGMSVEPAKRALSKPDTPQEIRSFLLSSLTSAEGVEVFSRILFNKFLPQIIISTQDLAVLERQFSQLQPSMLKASEVSGKKPDLADWFYKPTWVLSAIPANPDQGISRDAQSTILLFCDRYGLGSQLANELTQQYQNVVTVESGSEFAKISDRAYTIRPSEAEDYHLLLDDLLAQKLNLEAIAHLWSIQDTTPNLSLDRVRQAQDMGFYSLISLTQAIGKHPDIKELAIAVLSNNMQSVTGSEILHPEAATILGAIKVIPQEYPNLRCRSIDISLPLPTSKQDWQTNPLLKQLLTEIVTPDANQIIAYRDGQRWLQEFQPMPLETIPLENIASKATSGLKENGVYLITGGLGDIGLVLSKYLVQTFKAKLILTTRSPFPAQEDWEQWLSQQAQDSVTCRKVRELQAIAPYGEEGAEILVVQADVANEQQMREVLDRSITRFDRIDGVFHAAGITEINSFRDIQGISRLDCEQHFQPKLYGLLVLNKVLQNREIDFCVLMSSLASVLAGPEVVAYSAANIFMDSFVHWRSHNHLKPWLSVNWDRWQVGDQDKQSISQNTSLAEFEISPTEGLDALQRILASPDSLQIVVSSGDLQSRLDQWTKPETLSNSASTAQAESFSLYPRPNLLNPYVPPRNEFEQKIALIWQQVLGIAEVGIYDNFFELNGDSLLATQAIARIRETFNIELPLRSIFENSTVSGLAEKVETILQAQQNKIKLRLTDVTTANINTIIEEGEI